MIHFVVALPAEGKPLIDRYGLRRRTLRSDYPIYEGNDITLIVSGIGKVAAAAATACLHASTNDHRPGVWLNVGIAGHSQRPVGEGECESHPGAGIKIKRLVRQLLSLLVVTRYRATFSEKGVQCC